MTAAQASPSASKQPPLTAHPWFPPIVGLWFAALFGLCSLAVPAEMLERMVTAIGLHHVFAAAAPPLGQTARLLVALGLSTIGEIAGLLLGRRLAARHRADRVRDRTPDAGSTDDRSMDLPGERRARDAHPDAPPRKPFSPVETLDGIDNALRRRALASETEHEPRPLFESAPLPGTSLHEGPTEAEPAAATDHARPPAAASAEAPAEQPADPLDLAVFTAPAEAATPAAPFASPEPVPFAVGPADDDRARQAEEPIATKQPTVRTPAAHVATAPLSALGVVELSERLALAMQARRERLAQRQMHVFELPPVRVVAEDAETFAPAASEPQPEPESVIVGVPVADTGAEDDGQREVADAALPPFSGALAGVVRLEGDTEDPETDEIDHAMPSLARSLIVPNRPFSRPSSQAGADEGEAVDEPFEHAQTLETDAFSPADPEPGADADDSAEDLPPSLARGLEILARRAPRADAPLQSGAEEAAAAFDDTSAGAEPDDEGHEDEVDLEAGYSSLLAMSGSFHRPEPVRIEDEPAAEIEPVVVFPGQAARSDAPPAGPFAGPFAGSPPPESAQPAAGEPVPPAVPQEDADEANRALRAALASLQRISGAR